MRPAMAKPAEMATAITRRKIVTLVQWTVVSVRRVIIYAATVFAKLTRMPAIAQKTAAFAVWMVPAGLTRPLRIALMTALS